MAELWFVGLGLGDERGLSRRGEEALRRCERIFAEEYTATLETGALDRLAKGIGLPIERLGRTDVESERAILQALDHSPRVGFVTAGDPFAATTHVALRLAAERAGHTWRYVPNASIITAASGFLGLMAYRFGRTVSLPFPAPGFAPTSPIIEIGKNRSIGAHTLVLLDLRPSEGRFLEAGTAIELLLERDPEHVAVAPDREIAVVARVGSETAEAWVGPARELARTEFGPPLHAVVILAPELHFAESEAIARFRRSNAPTS
ncbi:MAG: diphthine synthase [Thermoplasmata archaeon]